MLTELGFNVDVVVYTNCSLDEEVISITETAYKFTPSTTGIGNYVDSRYNYAQIDLYTI